MHLHISINEGQYCAGSPDSNNVNLCTLERYFCSLRWHIFQSEQSGSRGSKTLSANHTNIRHNL